MGGGRPRGMGTGRLPAAALAALVAFGTAGAMGAEPSRADIQWAQTVLKEQGFDAGPARGEMNERTRTALGGFQKRNGLPVTGRLDAATTARLIEARDTAPTMGNLAAPKPDGAGTAASRPAAPPAKPLAAPPVRGEAAEPLPDAAPRMAVAAEGGDGAQAAGFDPASLMVPAWVRGALYAAAGLMVLALTVAWWLSGRRPRRTAWESARESARESGGTGYAAMGERVAPTLGPPLGPGGHHAELRAPSRGGYGR